MNNIDIYHVILRKFPNIFESFDNHSIVCNFDIADMLRRLNYGKKVNLSNIYEHEDFLTECQHDMGY